MKRRSMKRVNVKKENKPFKTLAIATIAGLSIIGVGQAQAATLDEVDLSQKPIDTPTLDYLHNNDVQIKYEDGTEVAIPQSNYTMTEVNANEDGSKPTGDNIITQYDYDKTTGSLSPLYYEINYQTQFGNPDGDTTLTFGKVNTYGSNYTWKLNAENPTSTITYKYNQGDTIDGSITNDSTSANIARDFVNTDGRDPLILNNENATINNITGNFIANKLDGSSNYLGDGKYNYIGGKVIDNKGHIDNIKGTFAINEAKYGLIYNNENATIDKIEGLFFDNWSEYSRYGNAVNNSGIIKSILADFISGHNGSNSYGVSIVNTETGKIGTIIGDFIGTSINNNGTIDKIEGTFTNNTGTEHWDNSTAAIYNYQDTSSSNSVLIKLILADFIANQGGGISNIYGGITDIIGSFIGNSISVIPNYYNQTAHGGAIYNTAYCSEYGDHFGYIGNITGRFLNNYVLAKDRTDSGRIFITTALGGAIYNTGKIDSITNSHFQNNYAEATKGNAYGGAIYNNTREVVSSKIVKVLGIDKIQNTSFIGNYAKSESGTAQGGAIYNKTWNRVNSIEVGIGKIQNTSFIGNYAKSESGTAQGGAIWSEGDLNIVADNGESLFSGNYVQNGENKDQQAIFVTNIIENKDLGYSHSNHFYQMEPHKATVTLNSINNGKIIFNDKITGETTKTIISKYYNEWDSSAGKYITQYVDDDYNDIDTPTEEVSVTPELKITGDSSSIVQLNNNIENLDISLSGTNLHLGARDNVLDGNNIDLQSGTLSMVNNQVGVAALNNVTLSGNTNFVADVDLANDRMDRITANNYNTQQGINLNVVGMNLLSDATKDVTEIYFAQPGLKNNVVNGMPKTGEYNLPSTAQTTFYTPIYKYNAIYDNRDDGGYFMFAKGDKILTPNGGGGTTVTPSGNPSDAFNPSVLAPSVASQAGANATMNQTFNYAFQNSDNFMTIPYLERVAIKTANRYALSPTGDATDVGTFSPLFNAQNETSSAWVKPYASFENIPLKNGPKVSNITYGTLVGFDTPIKSIKHGWDRAWTGYIGYNGASQRFSGVDATQNGGLVGGTLTLYKGNFFNATTISSGAIVGDNRTMYGTDNYTMLMAGVGNKTGYNFEFKEGKIIIQPSMLLSYTFVNTFDYTNAAGVKIKNDPLHAIQIAPGVKFIANTKNGWQPYIGVNMIWNLLDKSKVSANDVRLPEMSIKPYVQYGVGVQKRFKDRYMAFGQAMIQNGGRNGISLTAGFRWAIGKEGKPLEKVQRVNNKTISSSSVGTSINNVGAKSTIAQAQPERKIIKQLSQTQREIIAKQYQNTTRTTSIGEMKKL